MTTRSTLAELFADPGSSAPAIVSTSPSVVVSYKGLTLEDHLWDDPYRCQFFFSPWSQFVAP